MPLGKTFIAIIDVGHGNSTVLYDNGRATVVDCGRRSSLMEFLKTEGITTIDQIVLSHADHDHIGGLIGLIASREFDIKKVFVNPDSTKQTKAWEHLRYEADQNKNVSLRTEVTLECDAFQCESLSLKTLGPSSYLAGAGVGGVDKQGKSITSNSISASFHVIWKEQALVYLAGDIDHVSLNDLEAHHIDLKSPILVFPHHGEKIQAHNLVEFTERIAALVQPKTVIFSIGRGMHATPQPEIVETLKRLIPGTRIACTQLSERCAADLPNFKAPHLAPTYSQGSNALCSCSGTFVIRLDDPHGYWPDYAAHREFISMAAPTALCKQRVVSNDSLDKSEEVNNATAAIRPQPPQS